MTIVPTGTTMQAVEAETNTGKILVEETTTDQEETTEVVTTETMAEETIATIVISRKDINSLI